MPLHDLRAVICPSPMCAMTAYCWARVDEHEERGVGPAVGGGGGNDLLEPRTQRMGRLWQWWSNYSTRILSSFPSRPIFARQLSTTQ